MKKFIFNAIFILLILTPLSGQNNKLNFSRLDQEWDLFLYKTPQQVIKDLQEGKKEDCKIKVPGFWNEAIIEKTGKNAPITFGTYRLKLTGLDSTKKYGFFIMDSPGTSCAVYINNKEYAINGNPYCNLENIPSYTGKKKYHYKDSVITPIHFDFIPDENGDAEILFFINNYFYRKSGLWDSVMYGPADNIKTIYYIVLLFNITIIGIFVFIGLLTIIQYFINKTGKEYLYLGITSFIFALRVSTAGFCILPQFLPFVRAALKFKLEYMVNWVVPISILQMLCLLYPVKTQYFVFRFIKEKYLRYTLICCTLFTGLLTLVLPITQANKLVTVTQIFLGLIGLYVIILVIVNLIRKQKHILYYFFSTSVLIIGGFLDVVYSKNKTFIPISPFPFFLVLFIFIQLLLLAVIQNEIYLETISASQSLQKLNKAYLRFVPKEFLSLLKKDSITNIQLGDHSNIEMTIMFSKLNINYNESFFIAENNFQIFNSYLEKISPVIQKNNGFVSKFLSGGFMALFPSGSKNAVYTALEIEEICNKINQEYESNGFGIRITPRIGIHYGKMIIGTIGEENRLDDTVISDTVNTVSRIESVCERLDKHIIISENLYTDIKEKPVESLNLIALDAISVKGKKKPLQLFECKKKGL